MAEHENQRDEGGEQCEDEEENLPEAVGALALHLARSTVDDDLIDLFAEAVRADVDRQQEVFEGDGRVARRDLIDALLVASDVASNVRVYDGGGLLLRRLEALGQVHLIALRLIARQVRWVISGQLAQVPRFERRQTVRR